MTSSDILSTVYSGVCLVGSVFTVLCVPETRGKSIEEIQELFNGKGTKKGFNHSDADNDGKETFKDRDGNDTGKY